MRKRERERESERQREAVGQRRHACWSARTWAAQDLESRSNSSCCALIFPSCCSRSRSVFFFCLHAYDESTEVAPFVILSSPEREREREREREGWLLVLDLFGAHECSQVLRVLGAEHREGRCGRQERWPRPRPSKHCWRGKHLK